MTLNEALLWLQEDWEIKLTVSEIEKGTYSTPYTFMGNINSIKFTFPAIPSEVLTAISGNKTVNIFWALNVGKPLDIDRTCENNLGIDERYIIKNFWGSKTSPINTLWNQDLYYVNQKEDTYEEQKDKWVTKKIYLYDTYNPNYIYYASFSGSTAWGSHGTSGYSQLSTPYSTGIDMGDWEWDQEVDKYSLTNFLVTNDAYWFMLQDFLPNYSGTKDPYQADYKVYQLWESNKDLSIFSTKQEFTFTGLSRLNLDATGISMTWQSIRTLFEKNGIALSLDEDGIKCMPEGVDKEGEINDGTVGDQGAPGVRGFPLLAFFIVVGVPSFSSNSWTGAPRVIIRPDYSVIGITRTKHI